MATSAEIRNKAAKKLGVLGTGQTLRSSISADLDDAYTEVYGELSANGIATWGSSQEVPDEAVWSVVAMVAFARVNEYSVPPDRYARIVSDRTIAEARIRELTASPKRGYTQMVSF